MALSETSGLTFAYDMYTYMDDDEMDNANAGTKMLLHYQQKIAGQNFWAGYLANTLTNPDADDPLNVDSSIVLGARVNF